jgi:hypothetical protein
MIAARKSLPDRLGMALSGLCLVHCMALPLAVALLPVLAASGLGPIAEAEWIHAALLVPAVVVSGGVLGRRAYAVRWLGLLLAAGLVALGGALFAPEESQERALTVGGAGLLILAHWLNLRSRTGLRDVQLG